jgi:hypothetical protein
MIRVARIQELIEQLRELRLYLNCLWAARFAAIFQWDSGILGVPPYKVLLILVRRDFVDFSLFRDVPSFPPR